MGRGNNKGPKKSGYSRDESDSKSSWFRKQTSKTQALIVIGGAILITAILGILLVSFLIFNQIPSDKVIMNTSTQNNTTTPSLPKEPYLNFSARGVSFEYPSSWYLEPHTIESHIVDFKTNGTDLGRVLIWNPEENTSLEQAKDFTRDSVTMLDFDHIISEKTTEIDGFPAYEIIYYSSMSTGTSKTIKIITVVNGLEYSFEFWDWEYNFENGKPEFYRLINTTKFYKQN